ncbi:MAG: S8 family serine peptidase [Permianibacter sp.]
MKNVLKPTLVAGAVMFACAVQAGEIRGLNAPNVIPNRYIVVFKDNAMMTAQGVQRSAASVAADMNRRYGASVERSFERALKGAVVVMDHANAMKLASDPSVAFVEADAEVRIVATQSPATWGIDRIDQTDLPLNNSYTYGASNGVHAYIIDTGIRSSHNEFSGRLGNGYDAIGDGQGTNDCQGHGTHVAGTVGGTTYGVAKNVTLHAVRVLNCQGSGTNSGVIAGMDWVTANHVKPAVANMSLGGGASSAVDTAVANMTNAGVTVVVAAGNDSSNACNYSPARAASAITVGSTTSSDAMSSFSNYGSCVDIFAPGSSIVSAGISSNTATATLSGTSMASPHVAGAAALYLYANPTATPSAVTTALVNNASNNKISGIPSGPNKLLSTVFLNGGNPPPPPPPPPPGGDTLSDGVPVTGLGLSSGATRTWTMSVPSGASNLSFNISGGTGDADLYVRFGSAPTTSTYDCRPYLNGNNETCSFAAPQAGTYYVMLRAYSSFSGVSLVGNYDVGGGGGGGSFENTNDYAIPDNNATGISSPINVTGSGTSGTVSVNVNIVHPYIGDLIVDLVHPDGTVYNLHNRSGGSADNINQTYSVNVGSKARAGTWNLRVRDRASIDTGYINSWKITFP